MDLIPTDDKNKFNFGIQFGTKIALVVNYRSRLTASLLTLPLEWKLKKFELVNKSKRTNFTGMD